MPCKICKQVVKAPDNVCITCLQTTMNIIMKQDIKKKFKISKIELEQSNLKPLKYQGTSWYYYIEEVFSFCDKLYKDLPDNDKRKKVYIKSKKEFEEAKIKFKADNELCLVKRQQLICESKELLIKYGLEIGPEPKVPEGTTLYISINQYPGSYQNIYQDKHTLLHEYISIDSHFYNLIIQYTLCQPFDLFGLSMKVANELHKYHLTITTILAQRKRKDEIEQLIQKYNDIETTYIRQLRIYIDYIQTGNLPIDTLMLQISKELHKYSYQYARTILLRAALLYEKLNPYLEQQRICKTYIKHGKISLDKVISEVKNIVLRQQKHLQFNQVACNLGKPYSRKWKIYQDFMNDQISLNDVTNNFVPVYEMENRRKQIVAFIKEMSPRFRKCILRHKKPMIEEDYIKKNIMSFDNAKQIIYELQEEFINNATNLSDKWKTFLKKYYKEQVKPIYKQVFFEKILFDFCDNVENVKMEISIPDNKSTLYLEHISQKLGLIYDKKNNIITISKQN